jgi:hypothetical protein
VHHFKRGIDRRISRQTPDCPVGEEALRTNKEGLDMNQPENQKVHIVDLEMPFMSMVRFMVKWAIAAIPALLILAIIGAFAAALFTGIVSSYKH